MWTISKPDISAVEAFDICVEGFRDAEQKAKLKGARQEIENAERDYDTKGNAGQIYLTVAVQTIVGTAGNVTANEMEQLYSRHMARQKSRGHDIYDKLMANAPYGQCPFCGHHTVSTLDHTLPKKRHPVFAVTPINLIPSCKDCNHNKGTAVPAEADAQFLNAYYDDVSADRWLHAQIVEGSPPAATFFVDPPEHWDNVVGNRVRNQFDELKLGKLYASQAGRQLQNIKRSLSYIYDSTGSDAVSQDLLDRSVSCGDVSVNSWQGALYEAAASSAWYCNGGFRS